MSSTVDRLRTFAAGVLTHAGGVVEWPDESPAGEVLLPAELAVTWGCDDHVRLATGQADGDLRLDLAGDTLERLQALADAAPWTAAARTAERVPRKLDAAALVDRSVDIANARVRLTNVSAGLSEYHLWHIGVQLAGEESWEDVIPVAVHAASGRAVRLDLPPEAELMSWSPVMDPADTRTAAIRTAATIGEGRAAAFVARLAQRRERDRLRLRDYYGALLAPARRASRGAPPPTLAEVDARREPVKRELARKLEEVDERSRLRCRLQPVARLRLELPIWSLTITVQRRTAVRTIRTSWNHLAGGLEPLACDACGATGLRFGADDGDVALRCPGCTER